MPSLSSEEKAFIIRVKMGRKVDCLICEFPARQCKRQTLYDLVRKPDQTGSTNRLPGSGRPRSVCTGVNIGID